jgi:hypothetical protein
MESGPAKGFQKRSAVLAEGVPPEGRVESRTVSPPASSGTEADFRGRVAYGRDCGWARLAHRFGTCPRRTFSRPKKGPYGDIDRRVHSLPILCPAACSSAHREGRRHMSLYTLLKYIHVALAIIAIGFNTSYALWLRRFQHFIRAVAAARRGRTGACRIRLARDQVP